MQKCNVTIALLAAFPVNRVTRTDGLSRFWFGHLKTFLKYLVIVVIEELFLKNLFQQLHLKISGMV